MLLTRILTPDDDAASRAFSRASGGVWLRIAKGSRLPGQSYGRSFLMIQWRGLEADNAQLFLASAERHLGFRIDVISGHARVPALTIFNDPVEH